MRALLIGNSKNKLDNIAAAQLYPFFLYRRQLRRRICLEFKHIQAYTFSDICDASTKKNVDVIIIRPDWREDSETAERSLEYIRKHNPYKKIIFLDPFDQTSSRYFSVLPYVNQFLKYQRLKDVQLYTRPFVGGSFLTDYLAHELNYDLNNWHVGSQAPEGYESRIGTYWNFATSQGFYKTFRKPARRTGEKDIDVFCRLSFGPPEQVEWYGQYRLAAVQALVPLEAQYKLAVDRSPEGARSVSSKQYLDEIKRSRIVFSPFGWGEITWRDYEAACHGCLLIKPSVDHIDTRPNIFYPGKTYVPVRWDFQDLEEKCRYYLENPDEANQIIQNARQAYMQYFENQEFINTMERDILSQAPTPISVL
ncbi:MAG TPA: glycosyltransferase [Candidatus Obscuribacterales bacterium]